MLRRVFTFLALAALLIAVEFSCMKKNDEQSEKKMKAKTEVNSKNDLYVYLDSLEHRYEQACERMGVANWNSYSQEAPFDLDGAKGEFAGIFGDTTARSIIETWLLRTMNDLEEQTREPLEALLASSREKKHEKSFEAWDFDYALREAVQLPDRYFLPESVFSIIHEFQKSIGFDVDSLPIREVVKDIPYGGLSLAIKIPSDLRFLVNPTRGKKFYSVAFHEYGHSLKAGHTRVEYPILRGYEWIPGAQCAAYEEGVADMDGVLSHAV